MVRILVLGGLRVCADAERRVREELLEVGGGMSVDALVGEEGHLEFNSECDREPVKGFEDGGDLFKFVHPHQDPGSAVLYVLELLDALNRDPDEECIAVIKPGGDKGVDEPL